MVSYAQNSMKSCGNCCSALSIVSFVSTTTPSSSGNSTAPQAATAVAKNTYLAANNCIVYWADITTDVQTVYGLLLLPLLQMWPRDTDAIGDAFNAFYRLHRIASTRIIRNVHVSLAAQTAYRPNKQHLKIFRTGSGRPTPVGSMRCDGTRGRWWFDASGLY